VPTELTLEAFYIYSKRIKPPLKREVNNEALFSLYHKDHNTRLRILGLRQMHGTTTYEILYEE